MSLNGDGSTQLSSGVMLSPEGTLSAPISATVASIAFTQDVERRARKLFEAQRHRMFSRTDKMFVVLMGIQWLFGIVVAATVSPRAWVGSSSTPHVHLYAAVLLGGLISALPVALGLLRGGEASTRYVIATAQMMWSGLLIHLTGGRIETHFHVFGSLAFLGIYRDWKVYVPATLVVALDHGIRQHLWPESVFGVLAPESWRFFEHVAWVVFEDIFMVASCVYATRDLRKLSEKQALAEVATVREKDKSLALDAAMSELRRSQESVLRSEKLAAVGKLAASVGHELRNPLAAVRNAHTYIAKKVSDPANGFTDPRLKQFSEVVDRELANCSRIISDLLDFARERPPVLRPTPLKPLVDDAISVIPPRANVTLINDIRVDLPVPNLDGDQFRQVLINLVQNAAEAVPRDQAGEVRVEASGGGFEPWSITVRDNGSGIPEHLLEDIFQPLFTTKTKGTGLGLAIVAGMVKRHGGFIRVDSEVGKGTTFIIELPALAAPQQVA